MRILVTGGAGFIGSHLIEKLLSMDNHVICLDNLYTGSKENIKKFNENKNFEFILHDIINSIDLKVDQIYNMACPASPVHYQRDPVQTMKTSVYGILNMVELAVKNKATLLHASTSEVYGDPEIHPQTETYKGSVNPIGPRACYDEGKRAAETICFDYYRQHGLKLKLIRIFNTYGPRMDKNDGRVVSNFIVQALTGSDITIYGDGSQTRSFCYIDDLVNGIISMMNSDDSFSGPVNLGNPGEFTIKELAEKVIKLTNSKSKVIYKNLPADDPVRRRPDINLAQSQLKWRPQVLLNEGLEKTIEYFQGILN
ncbi:MAG: SDR family oxidoreductase [Spirochaetia bacterium]|nr:SDR family oxidoreductase [Spirochaetia bacterium]